MILSRTKKRSRLGRLTRGGVIVACGVGGAYAATKNRRAARRAAGTARGALHSATVKLRGGPSYDDITLVHRVESEIFRGPDAPKGHVNVNAADGVVELRGQVSQEQIAELGKAARRVAGVREVHNLLHVPGTPAPHSPLSTPDEVRARAERMGI
jgi:osmotically-inducible protein OsmY